MQSACAGTQSAEPRKVGRKWRTARSFEPASYGPRQRLYCCSKLSSGIILTHRRWWAGQTCPTVKILKSQSQALPKDIFTSES